ncbi:MAG: phosphatase PAP2 family protein [Clostridia bacterium]|nr:phosphatase PAP2 family protein [Clostridia bacterium]
MKFLYFLEGLRNPFLDALFSLITHLGEETLFLVIAIVVFWCINKREGYYILTAGLLGTLINQWLKLVCRVPRPWVKDPAFSIVESARAEATGYSFPSGHTQSVTTTLGGLARFTRRGVLRAVLVTLVALVALSRMYLGVHTPADVLTSLAIGSVLVFGLYPVFSSEERFNRLMPYVVAACVAVALGFAVYAFAIASGGEAENLASARKNAATLLGCLLATCVVYPLDRYKIKFETGGVWYSQLIKLVLGLGIILAIKEGTRTPLEWLFGLFMPEPLYLARGVRYFLIVVFAGSVWPLTFGFFSRLRIPVMEKFTAWLGRIFDKKQRTPTD